MTERLWGNRQVWNEALGSEELPWSYLSFNEVPEPEGLPNYDIQTLHDLMAKLQAKLEKK